MKGLNILSISISFISVILSISIIIYLCYNGGCFGIENISFGDASVSVLGTIVGLLIGWQIYKTIDIDRKLEEVENRYRSVVNEEMSKVSYYADASAKYIQGIIVFQNMYTEQYGLSYSLFSEALLDYIKAGIQVDKNVDNCISNMEQFIKQKMEWNLRKEEITYDYGKAVSYINQAIEIGNGLGAERIKKLVNLENRRKRAIEKTMI